MRSTRGTEQAAGIVGRLASPPAWCGVALAVTHMVLSSAAVAEQTAADLALAETLFQDGKRLMGAGDYAKACPKLAESYRLDAGTGTLLALALCHQGEGRTATAWREYGEVLAASQQDGRSDRVQVARERMHDIEPSLSRLTIRFAPELARIPGVQLQRNGAEIPRAVWNLSVPVDPGEQVVEATAPGKKRWVGRVSVGAIGDHRTLSIPMLVDDAPERRPIAPATGASRGRMRTIGYVVGGAGVAALGVGAFYGVRAISKSNEAHDACPVPSSCASSAGLDAGQDAKTAARIADVAVALGIAGVGVGVYLVLTSPSEGPSGSARWAIAPAITRSGGTMNVEAVW